MRYINLDVTFVIETWKLSICLGIIEERSSTIQSLGARAE